MTWTDPSPLIIRVVSVSTGWGSTGEWGFLCDFEKWTCVPD